MGEQNLLVVGLGASAGGLQAFKEFFANVPPDSGMAYVVILHLSPEHDSKLAEILQTTSAIPVTEVVERVAVEPNHAYVVSPRQSLTMVDGLLVPSPTLGLEERRAPIDIFFKTLADSHEAHSACVVLSGTGADGSTGLKWIKERGGVCLVQDPSHAEFPDMPRNALATGLADAVLSVAEMPARLMAYSTSLSRIELPEEPQSRHSPNEKALHDLFGLLRAQTGHDFSGYKRATVLRRIARRIGLRQAPDLPHYVELLSHEPEEARALLKDLLISVTGFFRDRASFDVLERRVIPQLFEGKLESDQIRVWVPGCATGEEAYSIAMLLTDYASAMPESPSIQIFATDIDDQALSVAREAVYTISDPADVSPDRLRRFFLKAGDRYQVRKELRDMVLFARHNLIKDPPFSHLDLVSCRNLLIYLNRAAQHRVMEILHFALHSRGFLFLGSSESFEGDGDLFVAIDKEAHIFQSRGGAARLGTPIPPLSLMDGASARGKPTQSSSGSLQERLVAPDLHQRLLEQYAHPSIVVNEGHDIVHLSDGAGQYLQVAGGEPSKSLIKAIRPELRLEVRTALYQAAQQRSNVETGGLPIRINERNLLVNVLVRPVTRDNDPARGFFLVLFEETTEGARPEAAQLAVRATEPALQLEAELGRLKSQLRNTVEQYETQTEELKASNEELQAINEELRSATEELETSKEELQSVNEELRTVNQELKVKIDEQVQANNDIQNLINSTDIGTVFLDRLGRIKLFTPRARDIFSLIPADRGRPLGDINGHLVNIDLHADVDRVLAHLERVEREVVTRDDRCYLMRVAPYRTSEDKIDGVVLTFVEITERKRSAERLRQSEERLRKTIEVETVGVIFFDRDNKITDTNDAFLRMSGYSREDVRAGRLSWDGLTPSERKAQLQEALDELDSTGRAEPHDVEYLRSNGSRWAALFAATRLNDTENAAFLVDITERKRATDALEDNDRRKNEFLATLAHELRNPLAPIVTSLQLLKMSDGTGAIANKAKDTIERQVAHMVRLADDLVEVSRVTLGKIEFRREVIDLRSILRTALDGVAGAIARGGHDMRVEMPAEMLPVEGDPVRLSQIFVNVLNNAIKYTPDGGSIKLAVSRVGGSVAVRVRDNGVGISERMLPHVFEMFAQGSDLPPGQGRSGLGIGLTLVRTLVEGHGGRVEVFSDGIGKGTEVVVHLPVASAPTDVSLGESSTTIDLSGQCVLVVDDNRDAADSLGALLTLFGATIEVVYSGQAALDAIASRPRSIAFVDIGMPGIDGFEVARQVRRNRSSLTLIALTGWGQEHDRLAALDAGFDHHLTKPADPVRLRDILESIVHRQG